MKKKYNTKQKKISIRQFVRDMKSVHYAMVKKDQCLSLEVQSPSWTKSILDFELIRVNVHFFLNLIRFNLVCILYYIELIYRTDRRIGVQLFCFPTRVSLQSGFRTFRFTFSM